MTSAGHAIVTSTHAPIPAWLVRQMSAFIVRDAAGDCRFIDAHADIGTDEPL